jgi:fructokinase
LSLVACFGETIWDVFPEGKSLGGAPLNVAYHLARLGVRTRMVTAVGRDALGDEAIREMLAAGIDDASVRRHPCLSTGLARVELDASGQAEFSIAGPVAWDEIEVDPTVDLSDPSEAGVGVVRALVFGTLALRTEHNRASLRSLLSVPIRWRVCDLNLRAPFDDVQALRSLSGRADVLKVNEHEAVRLADATAGAEPRVMSERIRERWFDGVVCITRGARGAGVLAGGRWYEAPSPPCVVRDTVGAGDAFTAALVAGLVGAVGAPDWETVLRRACALGSFVTSRAGAQPSHEGFVLPD